MMINRCLTVLLLALGILCAGWLVQASTVAGDEKQPPKVKKDKKPKEGKDLLVDGELNTNDAKDTKRTEMYCKTYTFKMVKGKKYQIDMKSGDFDAWLRLENPKGKEVAEDDDSGGGTDAQITYEATETGDFKVIATTFTAGDTGKFKLTVKNLTPDEKKEEKKKDDSIALKLKDGKGSFSGKLAAGDTKYNNKVSKTFEVSFEEGKTYQIDLMSADFDAYLYLLDADGKVLAEDDDSGGGANGLDSRIVFKAEKGGRYRLVASTFGDDESGAFKISVTVK